MVSRNFARRTQDNQPGRGVSRAGLVADVGRVLPHVVSPHPPDLHTVDLSVCSQQDSFRGPQRVAILEPVHPWFGKAWGTTECWPASYAEDHAAHDTLPFTQINVTI